MPARFLTDEERRERKRVQDHESYLRQRERPGFYENRRMAERKRQKRKPRAIRQMELQRDPPPEVIAERDRVYAVECDPAAILLGDPRPGRRAIDQRMEGRSYAN